MATDPRYGYYIAVEKDRFSDGTEYFIATAPEIPDCLFQADTHEAAVVGLHEVIDHLVSLIRERGQEPPRPLLAKPATVGYSVTFTFGFEPRINSPDRDSVTTSPEALRENSSGGTRSRTDVFKHGKQLAPA